MMQWNKVLRSMIVTNNQKSASDGLEDLHMGPEYPSNRKKIPIIFKPNFRKLQNESRYVSLKIGSSVPQKLGPFFSLFLMRKTLSSGLFLTLGSGTSRAGNEI